MLKTNEIMKKGYLLKEKNIEDLSKRIYKEYEESKDPDLYYKDFNILMKSDDGMQYESVDSLELFSNGILTDEKIIRVEITFHDKTHSDSSSKSIRLKIQHGKYGDISGYVQGTDENWVNGVHKSLENIIKNFEKQNCWTHKHKSLSEFLFNLTISSVGFFFVYNLILPFFNLPHKYWYSKLVMYLLIFLVINWFLWLVSMSVISKLNELFPPIEFRTGPDHLQMEKQRKTLLKKIVGIILIPIIISILAPLMSIHP